MSEADEITKMTGRFDDVIDTLTLFKKNITLLQSQIRDLEKTVKKEIKTIKKDANKKRKIRKPSGFAKPSKVSDELCRFMNKECGTEIARTEVTQYIINYIKSNVLQCEENKRLIIPDHSLKKLLGVENNQEITYFNLQKYMNRHFI